MGKGESLKYGVLLLLAALTACADPALETYSDHDTPEDFVVLKAQVPGVPGVFDRDRVMDDAFFTDGDVASVAQVQAFLERTPYNRRCFLADETVGGRSAAAAIVQVSQAEGISPIVMLARMQVEKSLIAKESRPSGNTVDYAFGCGCPDNRACNPAFKGLDKQIECAARTLRRHYDGSAAGTSPWLMGVRKRTLDPLNVTPENHATASLYSYTPWVLEGRGGNWLVWNVTLKFAGHFQSQGVDLAGGAGAAPVPPPGGGNGGAVPPVTNAWIGSACIDDTQCGFGAGESGVCQRFGRFGMCTVSCEGLCPDRAGRGTTFCVAASAFGDVEGGRCSLKSAADNGFCTAVPGLVSKQVDRYLGRSGASARRADVCVAAVPVAPEESPAPPPAGPPPAAPPEELPPREDAPAACGGLTFLGECQGDTAVWCDGGQVRQRSCGAEGLACGYVDDTQGWYCLPR